MSGRRKQNRFGRRALLKGAALGAGATLLGPMLSRFARADELPRRFVFVVEGNCFEPVTMLSDSARAALDPTLRNPTEEKRWWYREYQHESLMALDTPDLATARGLGALGARDLVDQASVLFGLSSKIVGGGHSAKHGALSSSRTVGGSPGGPTIDAFLASQSEICGERPFDAVRFGVGTGRALDFKTCAYDANKPAPLVLNPTTAYGTLFGAASVGEAATRFEQRGGVLSFAREDVNATLREFRGSARERQKLETYLASIEQLQVRQGRLVGLAETLRGVAPPAPDDNPLYESGDALDTLEAQFELATAALLGDLTNMVVLASGTGGDFGLTYSSVSRVGRHDMHHTSGRDAAMRDAIHTITSRQVDLIANLARTLADTPEPGGGTMLDHTLIVYVSDNGEQHHSTASEFPLLMLGGSAMGHRGGGRTLIYPGLGQPAHRQLSNVWNTLGHFAGLDLNDFGTEGPTRIAEGPLSALMS